MSDLTPMIHEIIDSCINNIHNDDVSKTNNSTTNKQIIKDVLDDIIIDTIDKSNKKIVKNIIDNIITDIVKKSNEPDNNIPNRIKMVHVNKSNTKVFKILLKTSSKLPATFIDYQVEQETPIISKIVYLDESPIAAYYCREDISPNNHGGLCYRKLQILGISVIYKYKDMGIEPKIIEDIMETYCADGGYQYITAVISAQEDPKHFLKFNFRTLNTINHKQLGNICLLGKNEDRLMTPIMTEEERRLIESNLKFNASKIKFIFNKAITSSNNSKQNITLLQSINPAMTIQDIYRAIMEPYDTENSNKFTEIVAHLINRILRLRKHFAEKDKPPAEALKLSQNKLLKSMLEWSFALQNSSHIYRNAENKSEHVMSRLKYPGTRYYVLITFGYILNKTYQGLQNITIGISDCFNQDVPSNRTRSHKAPPDLQKPNTSKTKHKPKKTTNLPDQINMDLFLLSSSICNILNTYFPFIMR